MAEIQLTTAEWSLMNVVWQHDSVRVREVMAALEDDQGWAYSTVKTMLDRLVEKGALNQTMQGITRYYSARLTRSDAQRTATHSLADQAFDGSPQGMLHFMLENEKLSARERRELSEMLQRRRRRRS